VTPFGPPRYGHPQLRRWLKSTLNSPRDSSDPDDFQTTRPDNCNLATAIQTESAHIDAVNQYVVFGQLHSEMEFTGEMNVAVIENELSALIKKGTTQGYLTYAEVSGYLPDETVGAEKLDSLIAAVENAGIELCDVAPVTANSQTAPKKLEKPQPKADPNAPVVKLPRPSDDPIRMYLSQMAVIPLLSREEEIAQAKRIEISRKQYRRAVVACNYSLSATLETLKRVHAGELPFDRTIKVSLTENLTKEQIQARMPHHFRTMDHLQKENQKDFRIMVSKSCSAKQKSEARVRFLRRRNKLVILVEELSLRSRRISPLIKQLRNFSNRMQVIKEQLASTEENGLNEVERKTALSGKPARPRKTSQQVRALLQGI